MTKMSLIKTASKVAVAIFLASIGLWLIMDSLTFGLAPFDQGTGRAKGCYTWLEDALRTKEPSDGLRQTQLLAGGMLAFSMPAVWVGRAIRRRPQRRAENRN
jgi:hypothetical protein